MQHYYEEDCPVGYNYPTAAPHDDMHNVTLSNNYRFTSANVQDSVMSDGAVDPYSSSNGANGANTQQLNFSFGDQTNK